MQQQTGVLQQQTGVLQQQTGVLQQQTGVLACNSFYPSRHMLPSNITVHLLSHHFI
jgi:hypothetical protein